MVLKTLPVALFTCIACIFLAWYFSHRARHKERMMLIERGLDDHQTQQPFIFPWKKIGIVILGLGVGMLLICVLTLVFGELNALPAAILVICGGASMIIAGKSNRSDNKS